MRRFAENTNRFPVVVESTGYRWITKSPNRWKKVLKVHYFRIFYSIDFCDFSIFVWLTPAYTKWKPHNGMVQDICHGEQSACHVVYYPRR